MRLHVAGGVGELGEHQHLAAREVLGAEQPGELAHLVVLVGGETTARVEEADDLVEVLEGLVDDGGHVVLVARQFLDRLQQLGRDDVLIGFLVGLAVEVQPELGLGPVADHLRVPAQPAVEPVLLRARLAVDLDEGQQLAHQPVERLLERVHRALEPLEEHGADQPHHLALAPLLERVDVLGADVVGQRVVDRQREQRMLATAGLLEHVEHVLVRRPDRVLGHPGRLALGKRGRLAPLLDLAGLGVGPAALHDQRSEHHVGSQGVAGLLRQALGKGHGRARTCGVGASVPLADACCAEGGLQLSLHHVEVARQVVHAEAAAEEGLVAAGEQLGHVTEVRQTVVDRGGGEQEHQLGPCRAVEHVVEAPVAGPPVLPVAVAAGLAVVASAAAVAEVVGLVDDHRVGEVGHALEALGELVASAEVGVAEHAEAGEVGPAADAADVGQPAAQVRLPHALAGRLGGEQHDPLVLVEHQPLDQHQPHERLAQAHAVAQERPAVLAGDLHQRPVGLLLVAVELAEHARPRLVPLARGELAAPEELVQRPRVHVERRELGGVAGDGPQHIGGDILGGGPVRLEPVLELGHLPAALNLDVQLDVAGEAGPGEVAGADKRLRAHHIELGVGDVGLGVELVAPVHPALDPALGDRLHYRFHALQERVRALLSLQAVIKATHPPPQRLREHAAGAQRHLVAHQQPDPLQLLPLAVQRQQCPDLEEPRRHVERARQVAPLAQILQPGPPRHAVVDDEQVPAARSAHKPDRTLQLRHHRRMSATAVPTDGLGTSRP